MSILKKYLLFVVILVVSTISVIPAVTTTIQVNIWSLGFVHNILVVGGEGINSPQVPPQAHQRASLWLARQALEEGDPLGALALVVTLAKNGNQDGLIIWGDALSALGNFQQAVKTWQMVGVYNILYEAALHAKEDGQINEAILAADAAWTLDEEEGALFLATLLQEEGNMDDVKSLLQHMVSKYPSSSRVQTWLIRLGDLSRSQKSWNEAVSFYRQALVVQPSMEGHINLGWVYYERGDGLEVAKNEILKGEEQALKCGKGYFTIGQLLSKEKHYSEAQDYYDKALECNPGSRYWRLISANNKRDAGNLTEALLLYTELIKSYPHWARPYYEISWVYKFDNKPEKAIEAIEQALRLQESQSFTYFRGAGLIYEWVGRPNMALNSYSQALSLSPDDNFVMQAVERLSENQP